MDTGDDSSRGAGYPALQIALHWLVVALILSQWLTSGAIRRTHNPLMPPSPADLTLHLLHNYAGMTIGALMVLRVLLRVLRPVPQAGGLSALQKRASSIVQWGLYGSLLAEAGSGFVASYLWGGAAAIHALLWKVTLTLALMHVAAAVLHAIRGDGVVQRIMPRWMLPRRRSPGAGRKAASFRR